MSTAKVTRPKNRLFQELFLIFLFLFAIALLIANGIRLVQIFKVQREILSYKEKIELTRAIGRKLGNIDAAYIQAKSKNNFVNLILPNSPDDAEAAKDLSVLADKGQVIFIDLTREREKALFPTELGRIHAVPFQVEFLAKYKDATLFLKNIAHLVRYFAIKDIQMESVENMLPNLYIKVKTETYFLEQETR